MTTMMMPTLILTQAVANWSQANAASDANKSGWHDPASALPSSIVILIIFVIRIVIIVGVIIIVVIIIVAACTTLLLHHCHHPNLTKIIFINIVVIITFKFWSPKYLVIACAFYSKLVFELLCKFSSSCWVIISQVFLHMKIIIIKIGKLFHHQFCLLLMLPTALLLLLLTVRVSETGGTTTIPAKHFFHCF